MNFHVFEIVRDVERGSPPGMSAPGAPIFVVDRINHQTIMVKKRLRNVVNVALLSGVGGGMLVRVALVCVFGSARGILGAGLGRSRRPHSDALCRFATQHDSPGWPGALRAPVRLTDPAML